MIFLQVRCSVVRPRSQCHGCSERPRPSSHGPSARSMGGPVGGQPLAHRASACDARGWRAVVWSLAAPHPYDPENSEASPPSPMRQPVAITTVMLSLVIGRTRTHFAQSRPIHPYRPAFLWPSCPPLIARATTAQSPPRGARKAICRCQHSHTRQSPAVVPAG